MVGKEYLLNSIQMAQFVARGFLRFDELIPKEINEAIMRDIDAGTVKAQAAGTPLSQCYPPPSAVGEMLRLPQVAGHHPKPRRPRPAVRSSGCPCARTERRLGTGACMAIRRLTRAWPSTFS